MIRPVALSQVSLRFFGDDLDPDEISSLLECEADTYCRKGSRFTQDGDPLEYGYWGISSPKGSGESLSSLVADLLLRVSQDRSVWDDLNTKFSSDLLFGVFLNTVNEGLSLSENIISAIADRRLTINFDIYGHSEDEE